MSRAARILDYIDRLRAEEGCAVEIPNDNPDFGGPDSSVTVSRNFGTEEATYYGHHRPLGGQHDALEEALRTAADDQETGSRFVEMRDAEDRLLRRTLEPTPEELDREMRDLLERMVAGRRMVLALALKIQKGPVLIEWDGEGFVATVDGRRWSTYALLSELLEDLG